MHEVWQRCGGSSKSREGRAPVLAVNTELATPLQVFLPEDPVHQRDFPARVRGYSRVALTELGGKVHDTGSEGAIRAGTTCRWRGGVYRSEGSLGARCWCRLGRACTFALRVVGDVTGAEALAVLCEVRKLVFPLPFLPPKVKPDGQKRALPAPRGPGIHHGLWQDTMLRHRTCVPHEGTSS